MSDPGIAMMIPGRNRDDLKGGKKSRSRKGQAGAAGSMPQASSIKSSQTSLPSQSIENGHPPSASDNKKQSKRNKQSRSKRPSKPTDPSRRRDIWSSSSIMILVPFTIAAITLAIKAQSAGVDFQSLLKRNNSGGGGTPRYAQVIRPSSFAVLDNVPPPSQANASTLFFPPGTDADSLAARPFLIYDNAFYDIIGSDPTLTLIASTDGDPLFHEANTWYPPTDEMFFVQNAGAPAAGTGLAKSAVVEKISLSQAQQIASQGNGTGQVDVVTVNSTVQVVNPNGATNFRGKLVFTGEGQGDDVPSALYLVDPVEPYETKVILNNYFGRQFNSLNDVAVNPRNKELYFTDVTYGYLQDFRPAPGLQNQVYRFNYDTGAVRVVADGFNLPNGLTFSPDGKYAYVADTGINAGFWGFNYTKPASLYRFDVTDDGLFENRVTFAFIDTGIPDGVHCDSKGNVYAGCGDGIHVWNPSGLLLGKIWVGSTSANFQFAGKGRMVISAETKLYYATLAAEGADITSASYSG